MKKQHRRSSQKTERTSASAARTGNPGELWNRFGFQDVSTKILLLVILIGAFTGGIALLAFMPSLKFLSSPSSDEILLVTEDFDQGAVTHDEVEFSGKPLRTEYGLATQPGTSWSITWRGTCQKGALPLVRLHAFAVPGIENSVTFTLGEQVATLPIENNMAGTLVVPFALDPGPINYSVTFRSDSASQNGKPALALDRLVVGSRIFPSGSLHNDFYTVLWAALTPLLSFLVLSSLQYQGRRLWSFVIVVAIMAAAAIFIAPVLLKIAYGLFAAALAFCILVAYSTGDRKLPGYVDWLAAAAFAALVLPLRWSFLLQNVTIPLPPDSADYMQIAQRMSHPFDTGHREPVFLWVVKLWMELTTWSPVMMRVLTLAISYVQTILVWRCARLFLSPVISMAVMALVIFNPALIGSSVQGLREEIFPAALLAHTFFSVQLLRKGGRFYFWGFTIFSGLLPLIRLSALIYIVLTMAAVFWRNHTSWRRVAYAVGIVILMIMPTAIYQLSKYGEPFYSSNSYVATFYRNQEFKNQPGYPTSQELATNPWAGEQVTMPEYVFGMHSFGDMTSKTLAGAYRLTAGRDARTELLRVNPDVWIDYQGWTRLPKDAPWKFEVLLVVMFILGVIFAFRVPQAWLLLLVVFAIQFPLSFLVGSDLIGWRLTMNGITHMLIICGVGVHGIIWLTRRAMASMGSR